MANSKHMAKNEKKMQQQKKQRVIPLKNMGPRQPFRQKICPSADAETETQTLK